MAPTVGTWDLLEQAPESDAEPALMSEPSQQKKWKETCVRESEWESELALTTETMPGLEPELAVATEALPEPEHENIWGSAKGKNKKMCAIKLEPTPEKEGNTTTSNTIGALGLFGVSSTTSNATIGGPPTAGQWSPHETERFQNILPMNTYKGWSIEELRLADYRQGHKRGSGGSGTGALGPYPIRKTESGSSN
ncbi:hypothetical protein OQA88_12463 [Cercophora sp. LCS_1]